MYFFCPGIVLKIITHGRRSFNFLGTVIRHIVWGKRGAHPYPERPKVSPCQKFFSLCITPQFERIF